MILPAILTALKYSGPAILVAAAIYIGRKVEIGAQDRAAAQQSLADAVSDSSIKSAEDKADKGDPSGLQNLP